MDARVTELVKAARAAEYWSSHGTHGDGRQAAADARLASARRAVESVLAPAAPGESAIRQLSSPVRLQEGDQVCIVWLAGDGVTDGDTMDTCTVVAVGPYTATVRVGWTGSNPMLMLFRRHSREVTIWEGVERAVIREREGVPTNYQD